MEKNRSSYSLIILENTEKPRHNGLQHQGKMGHF